LARSNIIARASSSESGLPIPQAWLQNKIELELSQSIVRDANTSGQFAKTGAHTINDRVSCNDLFDDLARSNNPRMRGWRDFNGRVFERHRGAISNSVNGLRSIPSRSS
jgi:hypothetical protein